MSATRTRRWYRASDDGAAILAAAGPTLSVPAAGAVLGIGESTARGLAKRGEFPVRLIRLGGRMRVATADVRALLGLDGETNGDVAS